VIDQRAVVQVLLAVRHVEPVQRALAPFGREERSHVVARQGGSESERVRVEPAVPAVAHLKQGDVEGALALLLQLVVVEAGAFIQDHLGHRIGEIGRLGGPA